MDWKTLVEELMAKQVTQTSIARTCGVSQSTVSDLLRVQKRQPSFAFGAALIKLHRKHVRKSSEAAKA